MCPPCLNGHLLSHQMCLPFLSSLQLNPLMNPLCLRGPHLLHQMHQHCHSNHPHHHQMHLPFHSNLQVHLPLNPHYLNSLPHLPLMCHHCHSLHHLHQATQPAVWNATLVQKHLVTVPMRFVFIVTTGFQVSFVSVALTRVSFCPLLRMRSAIFHWFQPIMSALKQSALIFLEMRQP